MQPRVVHVTTVVQVLKKILLMKTVSSITMVQNIKMMIPTVMVVQYT